MTFASSVQAGEILGIHILHPYEISDVITLLRTEENKDQWTYVTIPFGLSDLEKKDEWQGFMDKCRENKIIPLVRLVTKPEGPIWKIPTKKEIVDMSTALSALHWPTDERIIIVFNETNHAKEWGGKIDPVGYGQILRFTSEWFRTEKHRYVVLPAAMDLAAPTGGSTHEALSYWKKVFESDPELLTMIDAWNSHSYPNPGFSSSPYRNTQNSMRGFQHELAFLKKNYDKDFNVYITETGWVDNGATSRNLEAYYKYADENIWNDTRIKAVTPFLLRGAPGPFADFSFIDQNGKKTRQFDAYRKIID